RRAGGPSLLPRSVYGLEGRYATALYSAASKQKKLEQVEKELTRSLLKDPKLSSVVMNPHTKSSVKQKAVNDALAREKMSPITVNLMNLLAENGRLRYTPGIVSAFGKIMSAFRGEVVCTVTTQGVGEKTNLSRLMLRSVIEVLAVRVVSTCLTSEQTRLNKLLQREG
uniref:ATP synthase peripheral stalk subunit OSCP, mitochondrial n=1 Tax=Cyanoderma ruficeps TaxID=181631 RepID=A0A8C3NWU4_9PASS